LKENSEIIDIILFGSYVKKSAHNDIDISLITKTSTEKSIMLVKKFERSLKNNKFHIVYHIIDELFSKDENIWLSLFHEGQSLV